MARRRDRRVNATPKGCTPDGIALIRPSSPARETLTQQCHIDTVRRCETVNRLK